MPTSPTDLLNPTLEISSNAIRWYFIQDYYDGPIAGLAIYQDQIYRFCCFQEDIPGQMIYVLQELTEPELAEGKRLKSKFERMVGTYGCFDEDGNPKPRFVASDDSKAQFFAEEIAGPVPEPQDRPIVAWFDLANP